MKKWRWSSENQKNYSTAEERVNLLAAFFYLPNLLIFCHLEVYLRFPVYLFNNRALLITVCEIDMRYMQMRYHFEGFKASFLLVQSYSFRPITDLITKQMQVSVHCQICEDWLNIQAFSEPPWIDRFVCTNPRMLGGPFFVVINETW